MADRAVCPVGAVISCGALGKFGSGGGWCSALAYFATGVSVFWIVHLALEFGLLYQLSNKDRGDEAGGAE